MTGNFKGHLLSKTLCLGLLASCAFGETNATSELNSQLGGGLLSDSSAFDASTIKTYELGAVEITAPQEPDANPIATIVSKKDIENTASTNMAHALRFTPGVFYMPSSTYPSEIYIRGFVEGETGFYYDGIPIGDIYAGNASGETDLTPFFTFGLSEIQISKGYTSPTFSSSKMGGAVNMVSSIPTKDLEFNANYMFTANNEHRTNLQVGRNFGTDYFQLTFSHFERKTLNYSYDYAGGPANYEANYRSYMLSGKYGWLIGDNHHYSVNFYHQHAVRGDTSQDWSYPNYDKTAFYLLGNSNFGFVSLDSKVWYHMDMNKMNHSSPNFAGIYDDYSIGLTETLKFDFNENQNLKLGIMNKNENHEGRKVTSNRLDRDWSVLNSSVFTEYALRANDMFRFVVSGSYDRHDGLRVIIVDSVTNAKNKQRNQHAWGWTLQGILYFQPVKPLLFHANVGHKTNLPKIRGLYGGLDENYVKNDNLTSESLMNYEVGGEFNHEFKDFGTTSLGATAFFNDINNAIGSYRVDSSLCSAPNGTAPNQYCLQYQNVDRGYSYGGEVFAKQGFFGDKFTLGANWSYIQRKTYNRDNYGNRTYTTEFTTHPRQNINLSALIAPRKEYDIALNGSVQTSRYARVNLGTSAAPIYDYVRIPTVVYFDVVANYYLKDNLKLSLGAYNMLDRNYNYTASTTGASAGGLPGRRVFAGFEYNYSK